MDSTKIAPPLAAAAAESSMGFGGAIPVAATLVPTAAAATAYESKTIDAVAPTTSPAASLQRNFNRLTLSWENVNAWTPAPKGRCCGLLKVPPKQQRKEKHVLHNITGAVRPGQLTAIMGASGAGKTTLLNFLNGRNTASKTLKFSGEVRINGRSVQPWRVMPIVSAFVQQADLFIGTLTVLEHLRFQAHMRMGIDFTDEQREERIMEVMSSLGLMKCKNTIIGIPGRMKGISGGEMKRLSFASEVLTDPSIMFCDEPTSGLDSFMAKNVVTSLRKLCKEQGKTIVCVIHQPSSETFELFDDIILLSEGRVVYHGPIPDALDHLAAHGYACPDLYNPADFFIFTMAIQPGPEQERCLERSRTICDAYQASEANKQMLLFIQKITEYSDKNKQSVQSQPESSSSPPLNVPRPAANNQIVATASDIRQQIDLANFDSVAAGNRYKAGWVKQLRWVVWRSALTLKREPMLLKVRVMQTISIGLLLGLLFLRTDRSAVKTEDVQNLTGVTLLLLMNMSFGNMFAVINAFTGEMPVFKREYANAIYRIDTYYLAKILVDIPMLIILPFVMTNIVYWMAGLNEHAEAWIIICCVYILVANCAVGFGYCLSCAAGNIDVALSASGPLLILLLLFAGFFLNVDSIPVYFYPFKYISWFKYGNEALMVTQWHTIDAIVCDAPNITMTVPGTNQNVSVQVCPFRNGDDVLHQLNYLKDQFNSDIIALCCLLVGFRLVGFFILLAKNYKFSKK